MEAKRYQLAISKDTSRMNQALHKKPTLEISERLANLRPSECRVRNTGMRIANYLDSMDFFLNRKPLGIEWRIWKKYQQWHKYRKCKDSTDDMKPLPRGDTAS
jgi:hypothetical protein